MNYEKAWKRLKESVEQAIEEGIVLGFNKDDGSNAKENGMYKTYERIRSLMNYLENAEEGTEEDAEEGHDDKN